MDVNQIGIKINQTPKSNEGISRQSKTSMINFDQILSMFSLLGQSAELNDKEAMPSLQKVSNEMVGDSEKLSFDAEDWKKLDSILTLILAGIQQQPQNHSSSLGLFSENSLPTDGSLSSQNSGNTLVGGQKDNDTYDWQKIESALTMILAGLQQMNGLGNSSSQDFQNSASLSSATPNLVDPNQKNYSSSPNVFPDSDSLIQDTNQLLVQLEQIIEKTHDNNMLSTHSEFDEKTGTNKKQSMNNLPNEIIDKIQLILQTIKPENKPIDSTSLNSQLTNNQLLFDISNENQGINPRENKLGKTPIFTFKKDTSLPDNSLTYSGNPVQKTSGFTQTNSAWDSAPLQVSDFVPEVSEWIGRFLGNSNGQFKSAEAKFSLYPEHLGHIEIKITTQQGQISAQIVTDTPTAKDALEGQLQHLLQAIQQHGIVVQKLDIVQQPSVEFNPSSFSFSHGGSGSQDQRAFHLGRETGKKQKGHDSTDGEIEALSTSYGGIQKPTSTIDFTA